MRKIIPYVAPMKTISLIFDIHLPNLEVYCKLFEDNKICVAAKYFLPVTKQISISYIIPKDLYKR